MLLARESKKLTDIAKNQHKLFKDKIHVINNNRKDGVKEENGVKTEDAVKRKNDKITVGVQYFCDEYKIDKFGLMDGDLYLTNLDNQKLDLTGIANRYLRKNWWCR